MKDTYPRNSRTRRVISIHFQFGSELSGKQGQKEDIMSFLAYLSSHQSKLKWGPNFHLPGFIDTETPAQRT